jgi:hypothetical protein
MDFLSAECKNRIRLVGWILFFVATKKTWLQGLGAR